MKKLISVFILISISIVLFAQDECKVLIKELKGEYKGECKKGLAHGNGESVGIDTYLGEFKKGKPHGEGKYIYNTGEMIHEGTWKKGKKEGFGILTVYTSTDTIVKEGYWRGGEFYSKYAMPYNVTYRLDIKKISFVKTAPGNTINIRFTTQGRRNEFIRAMRRYSETGHIVIVPQTSARYFNCTFPFKGKLEYRTLKQSTSADPLAAVEIYCELEFEIYERGNWEVIIGN